MTWTSTATTTAQEATTSAIAGSGAGKWKINSTRRANVPNFPATTTEIKDAMSKPTGTALTMTVIEVSCRANDTLSSSLVARPHTNPSASSRKQQERCTT